MDIKPINDLMNKPMTRMEFLKHIGAAALGVVGVAAFIRNITNPHKKNKEAPKQKSTAGYGSGRAYGA